MNARALHITDEDRRRLQALITRERSAGSESGTHLRELERELERATVVEAKAIPPDVVTMHSRVRLRDVESKETMTYTLVYPTEADIEAGRLSVLSPIGVAILGYAAGAVIEWTVPAGVRRIRVEEVLYQPEAAGQQNG